MSFDILPILSGIIVFFAQISLLAEWRFLVFFTLHMGLAIASSVITIHMKSLANFGPSNEWVYVVATFSASVADALLTGGIILGLLRSRRAHNSDDNLLDLFVIYGVNSG
ncbi:hypothetical protein BD413DRAFT_617694 [Trametes elegans]|nr:hypothetical protein BD413DRAFT_617694 [Trametes elegans]